MQNKRFYAVLVLAVGIVLAALHVADLLQWMDASTGFAPVSYTHLDVYKRQMIKPTRGMAKMTSVPSVLPKPRAGTSCSGASSAG